MNMTVAGRFDTLKLTLWRLNNDWSPRGDTFSHQADAALRSAVWNDKDMLHALCQLHTARAYLERAWAAYVDEVALQPHEVQDDINLRRWNETICSTAASFDILQATVQPNQMDMLQQHIKNIYTKLF